MRFALVAVGSNLCFDYGPIKSSFLGLITISITLFYYTAASCFMSCRMIIICAILLGCSDGTYGENCELQCGHCEGGTCIREDGKCKLSCKHWKWLAFATSIEPDQSAHLCSLTRLYTVGWLTSSFHLDIPKNDNGQFQKYIVDYPFMKFGMVRVNW